MINYGYVLCACAKRENDYINDWCKYHLKCGFDNIFIYDNNDDDYEDVLTRIDENIRERVHIIKWHDTESVQFSSYTHFYNNHLFTCVTYIDIDEFITFNDNITNIKQFVNLPEFKNTNVIRIDWQLYDDNDVICGDVNVPVYERFTRVATKKFRKCQSKSIVKYGGKNLKYNSAHGPTACDDASFTWKHALYADGKAHAFDKIYCGSQYYKRCYIRHFMTKTLSEFINNKMNKIVPEARKSTPPDLEYFFNVNHVTKEKLDYILSQNLTLPQSLQKLYDEMK